MLEPARQSWFDRFPLNPLQNWEKKKSVHLYVKAVCAVKRVKSQAIVLAWQSGVRCAVSRLTWPGSCVRVFVAQIRVDDLNIFWELVLGFLWNI